MYIECRVLHIIFNFCSCTYRVLLNKFYIKNIFHKGSCLKFNVVIFYFERARNVEILFLNVFERADLWSDSPQDFLDQTWNNGRIILLKKMLMHLCMSQFNPNPRRQGPKGLSCFEKQTAELFLKWKKFKNMGIHGKL